jgi:hypothetical protein
VDFDSLDEIDLYESPSIVALLLVDPRLIAAAQSSARHAFSVFKNSSTTSTFPSSSLVEFDAAESAKAESAVRDFYESSVQFTAATNLISKNRQPSASSTTNNNNNNGATNESAKDANWLNEPNPLATVYLLDGLKEVRELFRMESSG